MIGKGKTTKTLTTLYREIIIDDDPEKRYPMRFGLDICVSDDGVRIRNDLAIELLQDEKIAQNWSDESLLEEIDSTIRDLGLQKKIDDYPDFTSKANELINKLILDFKEREAITVVEGLLVSEPLEIGQVTFYPFEQKQDLLTQPPFNSLFSDVYATRDCIATGRYRAEARRSIELLHRDTEYGLNILRFISSLVWYNEKTRQMSISGRPRENVAYSLSIDADGHPTAMAEVAFSPIPVNLNEKIIQYANFYGLSDLTTLVNKANPTEIEKSLLTAIQWFGDATNELQPLSAFMKFYIPIDILLKREEENAKDCIPDRLSRLTDPWNTDKERTAQTISDLHQLIRERNYVFHSGTPEKRNSEYLRLAARGFAIGAINQVRQRIKSEKLRTQDDLINWLEVQAKKFG